jgi:hypothetical protein
MGLCGTYEAHQGPFWSSLGVKSARLGRRKRPPRGPQGAPWAALSRAIGHTGWARGVPGLSRENRVRAAPWVSQGHHNGSQVTISDTCPLPPATISASNCDVGVIVVPRGQPARGFHATGRARHGPIQWDQLREEKWPRGPPCGALGPLFRRPKRALLTPCDDQKGPLVDLIRPAHPHTPRTPGHPTQGATRAWQSRAPHLRTFPQKTHPVTTHRSICHLTHKERSPLMTNSDTTSHPKAWACAGGCGLQPGTWLVGIGAVGAEWCPRCHPDGQVGEVSGFSRRVS